jgi:general secretion pathway protein M
MHFSQLKQRWHSLSRREHIILVGGSTIALILLIYALLWQPLVQQRDLLRPQVAALQQDWEWLQAAAEILSQQPSTLNTPQTSLLATVDRSLRDSALNSLEKRIEPQGEERVSIEFKAVAFNALLQWHIASGLVIESATLERTTEDGMVRARLHVRF